MARIEADQRLALDREQRRIVVVVVLELRELRPLCRPAPQLIARRDHAALVVHRGEVDVIADARRARPGPPAPGHVVDNAKRGMELHDRPSNHMTSYDTRVTLRCRGLRRYGP